MAIIPIDQLEGQSAGSVIPIDQMEKQGLPNKVNPEFSNSEDARKALVIDKNKLNLAEQGTEGINPYINALGETAVRSLSFPTTIPAGLAKDAQKEKPEGIIPTLNKVVTGQESPSYSDVLKGAGAKPGMGTDFAGGAMDIALYPGGPQGVVDVAKGVGKLGKAGLDAAGSAANSIKNKIAEMALNPEFRSTASTRAYGQDAKRVMKTMPDIVGPDIHSTLEAVNNKINETGQAIGDTIANHPNANVKLDASQSILKPFSDKIAELNKQDPEANAALIKRLKDAQQSMMKITDEDGNVVGVRDLRNMKPKELFDFRRGKIDPRTRYTGNPSDDKDVNSVFQEVKSNVRNLMNGNMEELKPLNQDYGDLHAAGDALQKLSNKIDNEGLPSINWKDVTTVGIHKWLANPINRINMSRFLYTAPPSQVQTAAQNVPNFMAGVRQVYGGPVNAEVVYPPKPGISGPNKVSSIGRYVPSGIPDKSIQMGQTTRTGVDRPYENVGLPSPDKAGNSTIYQGTTYTPVEKVIIDSKPTTDFGRQIQDQIKKKYEIPLHPSEDVKAGLNKVYPPVEKGNPNIHMADISDFNNMRDWESYQQKGGKIVSGGKQAGSSREISSSTSGHSKAIQSIGGPKKAFDIMDKAANGEKMTVGEKMSLKRMLADYKKNIKPGIEGKGPLPMFDNSSEWTD